MQPETSKCQPNLCSSHLRHIRGIKLTFREIDILACINAGLSRSKDISRFLQEGTHKTIEGQLLTLRKKVGVSTTKKIRDFIKDDSSNALLQCHYAVLENHLEIWKLLRKIYPIIRPKNLRVNIVVHSHSGGPLREIAESLKYYLKVGGVSSSIKTMCHFNELAAADLETTIILFHQQDLETIDSEKNFLSAYGSGSSQSLYLVLTGDQKISFLLPEFLPFSPPNCEKTSSFYYVVAELLKKIFPQNPLLEELVEKFNKNYKPVPFPKDLPLSPHDQNPSLSKNGSKTYVERIKEVLVKKKRIVFLSFGLLILGGFSLTFFSENSPLFSSSQKQKAVNSDLLLPNDSLLLKRSELMEKLQHCAHENKGIVAVGILGMGGVGKTTLARMWGRSWGVSHPKSSIWEINAETPSSLKDSFKELSHALAQTIHQKEDLGSIEQIQNTEEREKRRLEFVKACLKENPGWLLIYDNANSLAEIAAYLPQNPQTWGRGQVLITTRNSHIRKADVLPSKNIIELAELSPQEALTLFSNVRFDCPPSQLSSQEKEKSLNFLKNISLFPLDISIAGRYIALFNLSYEDYLTQLKEHSKEFNVAQEQLLKEVSSYTKTRYRIITLSLKKLMEKDSSFKKFLVCMSLMDSQNIPKEVFEELGSKTLSTKFLHEIKKFSLITNESIKNGLDTLSIHRSTQDIMLAYLIQVLDLKKNKETFIPVLSKLESYIDDSIEKEDIPRMLLLLNHCEKLLEHSPLLPFDFTNAVKGELGTIYFYIGRSEEAKSLLYQSIEYLQKHHQSPLKLGLRLSCLASVYIDLGDFQKGVDYHIKSVSFFKRYFSTNYLKIATHLTYLGNAYLNLKNHEETAKNTLEQAHIIFTNHHLEDHPWFARNLTDLGKSYRSLGHYKKAIDCLEQGVELYKKKLSINHFRTSWASIHLANAYLDTGDYEKARKLLEFGIKIYRKNFSEMPSHAEIAWILRSLARAHMGLRNYDKTKELLEESLSIYKRSISENHILTGEVLSELGDLYLYLKDYKRSKELLEKSLNIYKQNTSFSYIKLANLLNSIGLLYLSTNELDKAQNYLAESLKTYQNHPLRHKALESLGALYKKKAEKSKNPQETLLLRQKADQCFKEALEIAKSTYPKKSVRIKKQD